jgi:nucleoside-diphosphate-sugar epimerase
VINIAVTGASGFIGRHVVAELARRGIRPTVALRPQAIVPPWLRDCNVVRLDLAQAHSDPFAALGAPQVLLHLAWSGLPNYRSAHHVEQELPAQLFFLRQMLQGGLGTLLATGTCLEYGLQPGALEEERDTQPRSPKTDCAASLSNGARNLPAASHGRACSICTVKARVMLRS